MNHNIDVLMVIENKVFTDNLCYKIESSIPGVRLISVGTIAEALSLVETYNVKLLVITPNVPGLAEIQSYAFNLKYPNTLLLRIPISYTSCHKCVTDILTKWSESQRYRPLRVPTNETHTTNKEERTLNAIKEAVICCDTQGRVTYLNKAAEQLTGLEEKNALGTLLTALITFSVGSNNEDHTLIVERLITGNLSLLQRLDSNLVKINGEKINVHLYVNQIFDKAGKRDGAVLVMNTIDTHYLAMYHRANYDWLTDLPNRPLLQERINLAINLAKRHRKQVGLLFIDLDHFKLVNDSLGHDAGDQLLKCVSKRLTDCVRTSDTVSRHGGDEFVILLSELTGFGDSEQVAKNILKAFRLPFQLGDMAYIVGLSIGISIYPFDAADSDAMFSHADQAMYLAKMNGRNKFEVYSDNECFLTTTNVN